MTLRATFKLTKKDIKEYFSKARVVPRGGPHGKWSVQKHRAKLLHFNSPKHAFITEF